jgi:hypothetical protein
VGKVTQVLVAVGGFGVLTATAIIMRSLDVSLLAALWLRMW